MPNILNGELCYLESVTVSWHILGYNSDHAEMQSRNLAVLTQ